MSESTESSKLTLSHSLTAFDVHKELEQLTGWLKALCDKEEAYIDASAIQKIDTAGCQFIDMAITGAKKKAKALRLELSPIAQESMKALGIEYEI